MNSQAKQSSWNMMYCFTVAQLQLIYGGIIYNAVLHDSLLLPESVRQQNRLYVGFNQ